MILTLLLHHTGCKICNERLTTHILHYLLGSIKCPLVLVVFKKILEYVSKHLRVNTYLSVIRIVLVDSEVVLIEELKQIFKV